jgi:hypothetical protein
VAPSAGALMFDLRSRFFDEEPTQAMSKISLLASLCCRPTFREP